MELGPGEPEVSAWKVIAISELVERVLPTSPATAPGILAIDGRSGGGKSTFVDAVAGYRPATTAPSRN